MTAAMAKKLMELSFQIVERLAPVFAKVERSFQTLERSGTMERITRKLPNYIKPFHWNDRLERSPSSERPLGLFLGSFHFFTSLSWNDGTMEQNGGIAGRSSLKAPSSSSQ